MGIILGIDIGGSTTKIIGESSDGSLPEMLLIQTADPIDTLYGGIEEFLRVHSLELPDVSAVYLTGVGSSFAEGQVHGKKTVKVPEFDAIGNGALRLSGLKEALAVSMGTGTAFVRAAAGRNVHIGGTGIGGGTILGLASQMPCKGTIEEILSLAESGNLKNVDLLVGDIAKTGSETLGLELTASNFGKLKDRASAPDAALGLLNMVFETIGMMILFALRNDDIGSVVLTGTLAAFPQAKTVFDRFAAVSGKEFIIPANAVFATALGACPSAACGG